MRPMVVQTLWRAALERARHWLGLGRHGRDEYEFQPGHLEIAERPPAPLARVVALLLSVTVVLVLGWSVFGRLDIHASAEGHLRVPGRSKVVQAHEAGEIKAIHVRDGQRVVTAEPLLELNPLGVDAELQALQAQLTVKRLQLAQAQALLEPDPLSGYQPPADVDAHQLRAAREQLRSAWAEIRANQAGLRAGLAVNHAHQRMRAGELAALEKLADNIGRRLEARRALADRHLLPRVELLEHEKEWIEVQRALAAQHAELVVLKAQAGQQQEQLESLLARVAREQQDALIAARQDIAVLEQQRIRLGLRQRQQVLRAPVDGVVQQLAVHTVGGVVQPAQPLMVIVPEGAELEAEVLVLNKDVGFVKAGQQVQVKVDAYPYTRFGTVQGTFAHVSADAVKDERLGLVFPARIQLDGSALEVAGKPMPLQAGMSVTTQIRTGSRRVIDYLLAPIQQYQSEALGER
ncbi:HlyD family type I secretion periplasmic adaptor subunit [Pseudomonas sp. MWU13-3659]|uniref:HlyD family type I secretion periplasmic adaptor subunit n=1 Tax=Pseudomonas sp. MWU13-3659 TaxID=2986964 RepID=UPI002075307E|nr:HlyD family type I secretion periplasmic adaptor subunit [Pseudomonas sp. MWU13-3659]